MTRISLRETYDNSSVIAQIAKVTDTAEDAAETVQQKAAEINDALTDVNAAVQAAEGAVTTANAASASAQQSAQTVAGYENRLGTVEGDVVQLNTDVEGIESDLNAVTLRIQTAEGQIVTIQGQITSISGRLGTAESKISVLETADTENVKINRINDYAVGLTDNQNVYGNKTWYGHNVNVSAGHDMPSQTNRVAGDGWVKMYESIGSNHPVGIFVIMPRREAATPGFGIIACGGHHIGTVTCKWLSKDNIVVSYQSSIMVTVEQDLITVWARNINTTDNVQMRDIGTGYNGYASTGNEGFSPSTDKTVYTMVESEGQITGYTDSQGIDHTFITYEISS